MDFRSPSAGRRRRGIFIIGTAATLLFVLGVLILTLRHSGLSGVPSKPADPAPPSLADLGWIETSEGDFERKKIDVAGSSLRMRIATRPKIPVTDNFMGVRRRDPIELNPGTRVSVDVDWNRQENGSGLSAGILLAPVSTDGNPYKLASGVWVEFKGVPPGRTARRVIARRQDFAHHHLDMEGWPDRNRKGRPIGLQRLAIEVGEGGAFRVFENGAAVYESPPGMLAFNRAYVYLQVSSTSGHPTREILFGNYAAK